MKIKAIYFTILMFIFVIFSSCSKSNNVDIDNEEQLDNTLEGKETTEIGGSCTIYSVRYNSNMYINTDITISNMGAEWVEEYTGFVYLGEVKYSEEYGVEDFTTNIIGDNFKIYQCNEDCSIIVGCMSDNRVVVFRLGSLTHEEFEDKWNTSMWRDKSSESDISANN